MLKVEILDNGKGGHEDLLVNIDGLIDKVFDTYYFVIAVEPDDLQDLKNGVAKLLMYWKDEVQSATDGQKIHLPIDFSDQYSGCLEVLLERGDMHLRYGYTERGGWNVNPINLGNFSKTVSDFEDTEHITIEVSKAAFLNAIDEQIRKLTDIS